MATVNSTALLLLALALPAQATTYEWTGGTAQLISCPLRFCLPSGTAPATGELVLDNSEVVSFTLDLNYDVWYGGFGDLSVPNKWDQEIMAGQRQLTGFGIHVLADPSQVWSISMGSNLADWNFNAYLGDRWEYSQLVNGSVFEIAGDFGAFAVEAPEPGAWALLIIGLACLWLARRRRMWAAILLALSFPAHAVLFTATDTNSHLVNEYDDVYVPYAVACGSRSQHHPCGLQRTLVLPASGPIHRIAVTVSYEQSPFVNPDYAAVAMTMVHDGHAAQLRPSTSAPFDGLPVTVTFDDTAPLDAPGVGTSGTFKPYDSLMRYQSRADGAWTLILTEVHEANGFTRYLSSTVQVWADALPVPEPATWAMMIIGWVAIWVWMNSKWRGNGDGRTDERDAGSNYQCREARAVGD